MAGRRLGTIDTILGNYGRLSDVERRIADFIMKNVADMPYLSVREIAAGSGTSSASVSRFVRHMGYESLSDLRLEVAGQLAMGADVVAVPAKGVSASDPRGSIGFVLETKLTELQATAAELDTSQLMKAARLVLDADTVAFAAVGNSIPVCVNLAFKLGQIGLRTSCPANTDAMVLASLALRPADVLMLVSSSGYSKRLETIVDNAEDSGTPIVIVTSNPSAPLARRSDVVLDAVSRDHLLGMEQFSSNLAPTFVVELLFALVFSMDEQAEGKARLEYKSLGRDKDSTPTLS